MSVGKQGSGVFSNGQPSGPCGQPSGPCPVRQVRSSPSPSTEHKFIEDEMLKESVEEPPVIQIERDLDELTFSGAAINDLEVQLTRTKHLYQQVLVDGKSRVDMLRKKLHPNIIKSEPFIEVWRKARQVQELSNRAAARYDKANSQHLASKEMIRVAESQLAACRAEQDEIASRVPEIASQGTEIGTEEPSPLDLAWQEMLNHATNKVVLTEKERRDSELDHRRVLDECKEVMDEYRAIERKLRTHIVKSRPYFQERYRINQHLVKLKETMKNVEQKINESKQAYSASLKRLEVLNTEMHERRGTQVGMIKAHLDPRRVSSASNTPELRRASRRRGGGEEDLRSVDSMCMAAGFSGSTGSLPSIGVLSNAQSPSSPSSDSDPDLDKRLSTTPPNPDGNLDPNTDVRPLNSDLSLPHPVNSSDANLPNSDENPLNLDIGPPNPDEKSDVSLPNPNFDEGSDYADCNPDEKDPEVTTPNNSSPSLSVSGSQPQSGCGSEEEERIASDLVIRALVSATSMVYQESKSTLP